MRCVCEVCNTETTEAIARTWRKEDFVMRDKDARRFFMTLWLCPHCRPLVEKDFGEARGWLEKRLPPELTRST